MKPETAPETAASADVPSIVWLASFPVLRENVDAGMHYIWRLPDGRMRVVRLNHECDGITTLDDGDQWFFKHRLCGELSGPIVFR